MNGFLVIVRGLNVIPVALFESMDEAGKFTQKLIDTETGFLTNEGEHIVEKAADRMRLVAFYLEPIDQVFVVEFRNGFVAKQWRVGNKYWVASHSPV